MLCFACFCRSPSKTEGVADALAAGRIPKVSTEARPDVRNLGPRATIESTGLAHMNEMQRLEWVGQARLDAILGSCRLSLKSWLSGVRCWFAFSGATLYYVGWLHACAYVSRWQKRFAQVSHITSRQNLTICWLGLQTFAPRGLSRITWDTFELLVFW